MKVGGIERSPGYPHLPPLAMVRTLAPGPLNSVMLIISVNPLLFCALARLIIIIMPSKFFFCAPLSTIIYSF